MVCNYHWNFKFVGAVINRTLPFANAKDNKEMQKGGDIVESDNNGKAAGAAAPREGGKGGGGAVAG